MKLETENIDYNIINKMNKHLNDFKSYGYEINREELYKKYQKNIQKKMIKIRGEKI